MQWNAIANASRDRPAQATVSSLADLLRAARGARHFCSNTALDRLFLSSHSDGSSVSSSASQAAALKPGLPRGSLLDIAGAPGEGKSRVAVAHAVGARIVPKQTEDGRSQATVDDAVEVLLIDTEGDLAPRVLYDAALLQCQEDAELAQQVCRGIHHVRCATTEEFVALLYCLGDWLDRHPRVQLVVVDCLSTHLRTVLFPTLPPDVGAPKSTAAPTTNGLKSGKRKRDSWGAGAEEDEDGPAGLRASVIALVKRTLTDLTALRNLAVIVTNQVATKHVNASGVRVDPMSSSSSVLDSQLGQLWQPASAYRIMLLGEQDGTRLAMLYDTPQGAHRQTIRYAVDAGGIVDLVTSDAVQV